MATNKKITELTELTEASLADDDVLPIVDISEGTTHKVRKSTLASALSGVSQVEATSPIAVDQTTGEVTVSISATPSFSTVDLTGDTSAGDDAAIGYTAAEGLVLTGQGSVNDVTIKNDADSAVLEIPTGTTNVTVVGSVTAASLAGSGSGLTAGTTPITTLDIDGGTDIGEAIVDADLFIVDNGAGGTNRKVEASRLKTYTTAADASTTTKGIVELATTAETTTGTDTGRSVTPAGLHGGIAGLSDATITASDKVAFVDVGSSDALKTDTVQGILDLVPITSLDGAVTINESGAAVDFRVESNNEEYMFIVDGSTDRIGIGQTGATPDSILHVQDNTSVKAKIETTATSQQADVTFESPSGAATQGVLFNVGGSSQAAIIYSESTGSLDMRYGGSGTGNIKLKIDSGGPTLKLDSDFDNYETGTWTPSVLGASTVAGISYTKQAGFYTRIGRMVFYSLSLKFDSLAGSGQVRITGLPFTVSNATNYNVAAHCGAYSNVNLSVTGGYYGMGMPTTINTSIIYPVEVGDDVGLNAMQVAHLDGSVQIEHVGMYETDAS